MQYYKPDSENSYFGDAMPFWDGKRFHLYYLLDHNHHQSNEGKGGHEWEHMSTADLIKWEHHPTAVTWKNMENAASVCTGSVFHHDETFYAFYSTRPFDAVREVLGVSKSLDGITFFEDKEISFPNPDSFPDLGYHPGQFRDPCVFLDPSENLFHMLVSSTLLPTETEMPYQGCLAHLVSADLKKWQLKEPFIQPGYKGVPECSDYFSWNDWYYLLLSFNGITMYRRSRDPLGPWEKPDNDVLTTTYERVMKTAQFGENRRFGVSFLPTVENGKMLYGGKAVFREIIQLDDGTLGAAFPEELLPKRHVEVLKTGCIKIKAQNSFQTLPLNGEFDDYRVSLKITPEDNADEFGLLLKGSKYSEGREMAFCPRENRIELRDPSKAWKSEGNILNNVRAYDNLNAPFNVDIIIKDDIIDVCVNNKQCMITSCPVVNGKNIFLFARNSKVKFENIIVLSFVSERSIKYIKKSKVA